MSKFHIGHIVFGGVLAGDTEDWYFNYQGSDESWVVPNGVTSVEAVVFGGGWHGGQVYGQFATTPTETLTMRVGGAATGQTGGWPGGGNGGNAHSGSPTQYGSGGSGYTGIFRGSTPLIIAGGESGMPDQGGSNYSANSGPGAEGGTGSSTSYTVDPGTPNGRNAQNTTYGGKGGSQTAGGAAGSGGSGATSGSAYQGGTGSDSLNSGKDAAGGGGGGYYGGGGGGYYVILGIGGGYGGGGGSCYVDSGVTGEAFKERDISYPQTWATFPYTQQGSSSLGDWLYPLMTNAPEPSLQDGITWYDVYGPPFSNWNAGDGIIVIRSLV